MYVCGSPFSNPHNSGELVEPKQVTTDDFDVVGVMVSGNATFALIDNPGHANLDLALLAPSFTLHKFEKKVWTLLASILNTKLESVCPAGRSGFGQSDRKYGRVTSTYGLVQYHELLTKSTTSAQDPYERIS